jgi:valyl-tRNA synthetase
MIKPVLYGKDRDSRVAALSTVVHVFKNTLALLHPFIPFVTEELWQNFRMDEDPESLCISKYPTDTDGMRDRDAEDKMTFIIDAITGIRNIRGELNLPPSLEVHALIKTSDGAGKILNENISYISRLAKAKDIRIGSDIKKPEDAAVSIKPSMEIFVPLKGLFNVETEIKRLEKEKNKIEESLDIIQKKLSNHDFLNKAPKSVVEANRAKYQESIEKIQVIQSSIEKLKKWRGKK